MRIASAGAVIMALAIAGCAPTPQVLVGPSFRDQSVAVTSIAGFDAARFAGTWRVVARLAAEGDPAGTMSETFDMARTKDGFAVRHVYGKCDKLECVHVQTQELAKLAANGRFSMKHQGIAAEHWVHWVDGDFRVAAVGTPDGTFGWIMARSPKPRGDLVKAAKEILHWQGYDIMRLRKVSQ